MQLQRIKSAVIAGWVMAAVLLALVARDLSWQIWAAFVALAVLPPVALLYWWTDPGETLSEAIHSARGKTWPS